MHGAAVRDGQGSFLDPRTGLWNAAQQWPGAQSGLPQGQAPGVQAQWSGVQSGLPQGQAPGVQAAKPSEGYFGGVNGGRGMSAAGPTSAGFTSGSAGTCPGAPVNPGFTNGPSGDWGLDF